MEQRGKHKIAAQLGARIAELREEEGLSQARLAERLGIGEEAVSRMERGMTVPSLPRLYDIADALRRTVDEFLLRASPRVDDQALAHARDMERLRPEDQALVSTIVSRLVSRLAQPKRRH